MPGSIRLQPGQTRAGNGEGLPIVGPDATAAQLGQIVANSRNTILGKNRKINNDESGYLLVIAQHPNASDEVKSAIKAMVADAKGASPALKAWAQNFRPGVVVAPPDLPPPSVVPNGPSSGVGGGGGPVDLRPDVPPVGVIHFKGETTFDSPYRLNPASLAGPFGGLPNEQAFGKVLVKPSTGGEYEVRDNQFYLGNGKYGVRLYPAANGAGNSKEIDLFLRKRMGIGPEPAVRNAENYHKDRIYASVVYWHPELYNANGIGDLAKNMLATEGRQTHEGAYLGDGATTNSPRNYHGFTWGLTDGTSYPAHVFFERMKGVDQSTYNWQGFALDKVLNNGVEFPNDYKNDTYRTRNLNTALMFFRDWVMKEPYLKDDDGWKTYCAEHKNVVRILRANLPLNEVSFKEAYGDEVGAKVWAEWSKPGGAFEEAHGVAWRADYETHFEAAWKRDRLEPESIRPWGTVKDWDRYDAARRKGPDALEAYRAAGGLVPLDDVKAMPYACESTSDLIRDFVETYASFSQVGGIVASATIMSFMDTCVDRLRLDVDAQGNADPKYGKETYLGYAMPVIQELLYHEALVQKSEGQVPLAMWLKGAEKGLLGALAGDNPAAAQDPGLKALVANMLKTATEKLPEIDAGAGLPRDAAYKALRLSIADELAAAREIIPSSPAAIERNAPPGLLTRILLRPEHHPTHRDLTIEYACTAVEARDIVPA